MRDHNGGSVPQHQGPQLDPEEAPDNRSGGNILVDCCPPQAPSMSEEGIQNLCAITTLDDGGFNRALDIIRTPGAPIHFLVMREMERVILQESERLNHPANTKPANHPVNPEPSTPARFIFSAVMKDQIQSLTKKAFLRHNIDLYMRGSYKDGTHDKSFLTITMAWRDSPKALERELPPGYFHGNPAAQKALLAQVRKIQKHKLAESIFRFLNPAKVSMTQAQVREAISMLYVTRISHLQLQTLQHLLSPGIKRVS
ncbi:hypothetical protein PCASD_17162 [Puccinia coronata f. sp. avenae]|uniref:Uncharacterized protein n=1 Tax=Puccinia coronata f. sp. avenae TaxID=200324 RepID=A0A2N5SU57_9BASI|nr:hypothetical protein PCASD_17162 [Puccinia coronata f. sp. avenae]